MLNGELTGDITDLSKEPKSNHSTPMSVFSTFTIPKELVPPQCPMVPHDGTDDELAENVQALNDTLKDMARQAFDFVSSVGFYQVVNQHHDATKLVRNWQAIQVRSGAMSLRNFKVALEAVRGFAAKLPGNKYNIDRAALRDALKRFKVAFPNVEKVRHSVAHPELFSDPSVKMGTDKPLEFGEKSGTVSILGGSTRDSIINHQYTATINGVLVQYPVTGEAVIELIAICTDAFNCFPRPHQGMMTFV